MSLCDRPIRVEGVAAGGVDAGSHQQAPNQCFRIDAPLLLRLEEASHMFRVLSVAVFAAVDGSLRVGWRVFRLLDLAFAVGSFLMRAESQSGPRAVAVASFGQKIPMFASSQEEQNRNGRALFPSTERGEHHRALSLPLSSVDDRTAPHRS